jgi:hypothetical protein
VYTWDGQPGRGVIRRRLHARIWSYRRSSAQRSTDRKRHGFLGAAPIGLAVGVGAEKAGLEVRDLENLREHYALTLRHWVNRLAECHKEAVKASDEVTYTTWRLHMSASAHGFESGNVNQTLLAEMTSQGKSNVPLSHADLYTPR